MNKTKYILYVLLIILLVFLVFIIFKICNGVGKHKYYDNTNTQAKITQDNLNTIPKDLYIYYDTVKPSYEIDGFETHYFDAKACENFINENCEERMKRSYEKTRNKKMFWVYCVIFLKGGFYIDEEFFPHRSSILKYQTFVNSWIACLSRKKINDFFILGSFRGNPILKKIIRNFNTIDRGKYLYDLMYSKCPSELKVGINKYGNHFKIILIEAVTHILDFDGRMDSIYRVYNNWCNSRNIPKLDLGKTKEEDNNQKNIFRAWCTRDPDDKCGGRKGDVGVLKETQANMKGWKQTIYSDSDIEKFFIKEFGKNHDLTRAYFKINPKYGAAKADIFRYVIIWKYGGLYLDMKSCVYNPLPPIPDGKDIWVSGWNAQYHLFNNGEYMNWFIYAKKGCPVLKEVIETIVCNILFLADGEINYQYFYTPISETIAKSNVLAVTGPVAFTNTINFTKYPDRVYDEEYITDYVNYFCAKTPKIDVFNWKNHYSQQIENLVFRNNSILNTPNNVFFSVSKLSLVPKSHIEHILENCKGFNVYFFEDSDCVKFLRTYYGKTASELFYRIPSGAHRCDFWRYCILYLFGGYYFDISTVFLKPLKEIFMHKRQRNVLYSVLSKNRTSIYQGVLVTPPLNPIILEQIIYIYTSPPDLCLQGHDVYTTHLYKCIKRSSVGKRVVVNEYIDMEDGEYFVYLFNENCGIGNDKYNYDCTIEDGMGNYILKPRDEKYPWKNKNKNNYEKNDVLKKFGMNKNIIKFII